MKSYIHSVLIVSLLTASLMGSNIASAEKPDDSDALAGVQATKTLFDVSVGDAQKLVFYLNVFKKTYDDLVRQGQHPDMIIAFRGPSVRLINNETWSFSEEDQEQLKKAAQLLKELKSLGVRLEACSVATELFKVDNSTILPEIHVVGNTFISLTGYQSKGYALIPVH